MALGASLVVQALTTPGRADRNIWSPHGRHSGALSVVLVAILALALLGNLTLLALDPIAIFTRTGAWCQPAM